ncbi:Complex I intermediate-associated protein 30, mitochondrial [Labeo rohita]|uniref:Complex I intermediate-associated protein 30, mitochondrial n=1 Tax=Labeo rohita TaxID=84645 RepID=A0ABQ8L5S1_LABRO|nr:Complex I intermediate-associated protein 30, mitochondrial [Labeo rohita]
MDTADHLENLGAVLKRLENAGLLLKREKLPIKDEETEEKKSEQVLMLDVLGDAPVDMPQIRRWTSRDVVMSRVQGDTVYARNDYGPQWVPAVVEKSTGPLSYTFLKGTGQKEKTWISFARNTQSQFPPIIAQGAPVIEGGIVQPVSSVPAEPAGWKELSLASQGEPGGVVEQLPKAGSVDTQAAESLTIRKSAREKPEPGYLKDFVR